MQSALTHFDRQIITWVNHLPRTWRPTMDFASLIGEPVVMGAVLGCMIVAGFGWHRDNLVKAGVLGEIGLIISNFLKLILHRTRPDTYVPRVYHSYSFPSGHALGTAMTMTLLGYLAIQHLPRPYGHLMALGGVAFVLWVGMSRLYLGAHYPTDVLGGWAIGVVFAVIIIKLAHL